MIRINLLGVDRQKAKRGLAFDIGKQTTLVCSLILVVAIAGIGWWYWMLSQTAARLDGEIAAAQQESARLQSVMTEVGQFERRRQEVQQRVALIEELRRGQSIPVQVLDHVSRSLPDMMWLTALDQSGTQLTLQGQGTTLIALSDFVGNLGNGTVLSRPIEIVNSQVDQVAGGLALVQFTVRAQVNVPQPPTPPGPPAGRGRGARGRGRGGRAG
jgi:type IV pilus assembly protein PilN